MRTETILRAIVALSDASRRLEGVDMSLSSECDIVQLYLSIELQAEHPDVKVTQ